MRNKKGLANSLLAIMIFLFLFGVSSLIYITFSGYWSDAINNLDSNVASNETKQEIANQYAKMNFVDTFFTILLIILLIGYIITSFTLPAQNAWFFLLFAGFLILVAFIAMIFSNSWTYMLSDPFFSSVADSVPITDYVLRHFPLFIFLTGVVGGVIFYSRSREDIGDVGLPPSNDGGPEF